MKDRIPQIAEWYLIKTWILVQSYVTFSKERMHWNHWKHTRQILGTNCPSSPVKCLNVLICISPGILIDVEFMWTFLRNISCTENVLSCGKPSLILVEVYLKVLWSDAHCSLLEVVCFAEMVDVVVGWPLVKFK